MINHQAANTHKLLVELSVVQLEGNRQVTNEVPNYFDIGANTGFFYEGARNTLCIEGEWDEISEFIHKCYDRVQAQSPQGFLRVSIR